MDNINNSQEMSTKSSSCVEKDNTESSSQNQHVSAVKISCKSETQTSKTAEEKKSNKDLNNVSSDKDIDSFGSNKKCTRASNKRIKENWSPDLVLKEIGKITTSEEKISSLIVRYAELYNEYYSLHSCYKANEKKMSGLQKEKESLQTDYSKAILARSRLEDLCRELQRQNRVVKEESLLRVREVEEKRKEVSSKFQTTLNDITSMLHEHQVQSAKLQEENAEMSRKLKDLLDQYQLREQHIDKLVKHKELEDKISDAKMAKLSADVAEEKEMNMMQRKKLLEEVLSLQKKCAEHATNELKVRRELEVYKEKYVDFQANLKKSNSIFSNFEVEIEKMSKKIGKLEKESVDWQSRWKSSNRTLVEMAETKQKSDQQLMKSKQKVEKLEKLCRALQQERNDLRGSQQSTANQDDESPTCADNLNESESTSCKDDEKSETLTENPTETNPVDLTSEQESKATTETRA